jgi:hypothetical protein
MPIQGSFINFTPAIGFTGATGEFFGFSYNNIGQPIGNIDSISTKTYSPSQRTTNTNAGFGEGMTLDDNITPGGSVILGKGNFVAANNKQTLGDDILIGKYNSSYNTAGVGSGFNVFVGASNRGAGQIDRNTTVGINNSFWSGSAAQGNSSLGLGNQIGGNYNAIFGYGNSTYSGTPQYNSIFGFANNSNTSTSSTTIGFANTNAGNNNSVAIGSNIIIDASNNAIAIGNTALVNAGHANTAVIGYNISSVGGDRTHMLQPNVRNLPATAYGSDSAYYAGVPGGTAGDFYMFDNAGVYLLTVAGYNP